MKNMCFELPFVRVGFSLALIVCSFDLGAIMELASPESQGVPSSAILSWVDACERTFDGGKLGALHGFVLVRHGRVIAEGSWMPFDTLNEPHRLYSHSKSFTSSAVGLLVDDGELDLDERVIDIFSNECPKQVSANLKALRVRDLLTMNVGKKDHLLTAGGDWVRSFLSQDFPVLPGMRMRYDSDATYMLSAIVAKRSGEDTWEFIRRRILNKIGITKAWTGRSPQGIPCGGWGMNMTTRELARFGQLYLQRGRWGEEQILSSEWIDLATARHTWCSGINIQSQVSESGDDWQQGYGFQFWRCQHGAYRADGADGQLTVVMPEQDAVLSVHAGMYDYQKEMDLIWDYLFPAFGDSPLVENPVTFKLLQARLTGLSLKPISGSRTGGAEKCFGKAFVLGENARKIRSVRLGAETDGWSLTLDTPSGVQSFPVGYGAWAKGHVALDTEPFEGLFSYPGTFATAASGAFDAEGVFRARVYLTDATCRLDIVLLPGEGRLACSGLVNCSGKAFGDDEDN